MQRGVIKFFNRPKGYGFIASLTDGKDYFFHFSSCNYATMKEEDEVTFDFRESKKFENTMDAINIGLLKSKSEEKT